MLPPSYTRILLLAFTTGTLPLVTVCQEEEPLKSKARSVCGGDSYKIGCTSAGGTSQVLNVKSVGLLMAVEMEALQCSAGLDCLVRIGEGESEVTNQKLMKFYDSIKTNCHGKSVCEGSVPQSATFSLSSNEDQDNLCEFFLFDIVFLSYISIDAICIDESQIVPYEAKFTGPVPETSTVNATTQQTQPTESDTSTVASTTEQQEETKPSTTADPKPTEPVPPPQLGNEGPKADETFISNKMADSTIAGIVVGICAGVAVTIAVAVVLYMMFNRASKQGSRGDTASEEQQMASPT